ncbi:class I adenylate-forming enzyme family protein [Hydrogenophaga sp.]|uniref:class I adenylate-forming enzyme family protein n=1 Tax=Hydrogenophaga sp. TaxID=1904254 RepID=UPI003F6F4FCE
MHLIDYIERAALLKPAHPALIGDGKTLSFDALAVRVHEVGAALDRLELSSGATVAILADNCPDVCVLQLAINLAGLAWTSIHSSITEATTAEVLSYLDAECVFFQQRYEGKARMALDSVPGIKTVVCMDATSTLGPSLETWRLQGTREHAFAEPALTTPAWLQHTGGPGGACHGTIHSRAAIEIGLANVVDSLDANSESRHLVVAPLTHAAGIFALAFASVGATNVIHDQFIEDDVQAALESEGISHLFLPPTALYALLDHVGTGRSFPALRCIVVAGAPVSPERFEQAVAVFGPVLYEVFGQTETLLALVKRPSDYMRNGQYLPEIARSAGRPVRFAHVTLLDDSGAQSPVGERGEIAIRSSMLMEGYHRKPELTARGRRGGWHLTGDIGVADAAGYITIVDRKREMIVSGSFNVFPGEVEERLSSHETVSECAVIGVPHGRWGEAVHAVVALRPGSSFDEDALIAWCKQGLGSVKAPKSIGVIHAGEFPRDARGAIDKPRLKAPYWDGEWRRV